MQIEIKQDFKSQGHPKCSHIMRAHLKDYEVMKYTEITYEGLVNFCLFADCDPILYEKVASDEKQIQTMNKEIQSIEKNNTWELTFLLVGKKPIGVKWVYKTKYKLDGNVDQFKARLVAKGYKQKLSIDYCEVFASVSRLDTIRMIIALATQKMWKIHQTDVKSTFLNGNDVLEEQVFVEQPSRYIKKGEEKQVYKLNKALYGLKQAPRAWYTWIDNMDFKRVILSTHFTSSQILMVM